MANPQIEDGFLRIANELVDEAWKLLTSSQAKLFIPICRLTFGFNKKEAVIPIMRLVEISGFQKRQVINVLNEMETDNIIKVVKHDYKPSVIGINKNYNEWLSGARFCTSADTDTSAKNGKSGAKTGKKWCTIVHPLKDNKDNNKDMDIYIGEKLSDVPEEKKEKAPKKPKPEKIAYAEFVEMTTEEYQKLIDQFGESTTQEKIDDLNFYKGSKGAKYASDYLTILAWERNDKKKREEAKRNGNGKPKIRI